MVRNPRSSQSSWPHLVDARLVQGLERWIPSREGVSLLLFSTFHRPQEADVLVSGFLQSALSSRPSPISVRPSPVQACDGHANVELVTAKGVAQIFSSPAKGSLKTARALPKGTCALR